jgi:hypothetical protein
MRAMLFNATAALALAACSSGDPDADGDGAISMSEAAEEAERSGLIRPDPGMYRVEMAVLEVDLPGAPPQAIEMMKDMMGGQSHQYCLTAEDAEKGFEEMARQSQDGECTFERFDADGGDIDARMVCELEGQGTTTMTMTGSATRTSSQMEMTMQGDVPGMGESTMKMRSTQQRIGDCEA